MVAYGSTQVSSYKSQEGIRKILLAHKVKGVQFSENFETREIVVKFAKDVEGSLRTVKVAMTIPEPSQPKRKQRVGPSWRSGRPVYRKTQQDREEQMARATYRALHYWLKSQFEAVDFGLLTFEDIFLSHFEWMINGRPATVGELIKPYLSQPQLQAPAMKDVVEGVVED